MRIAILSLLTLCCMSWYANAQEPDPKIPVRFMTPEVAAFVKYGNIPVTYYTGQAGYSIPLFNVQDGNFTIPVSLSYNGSGFMPNRPEGITGLNWYLSAGGTITRKVNGAPDDQMGYYVNAMSDYHLPGFAVGVRSAPYDPEDVYAFRKGRIDTRGFWNLEYDYEPDQFNFSFLGHSGSFFISNDGNVKVRSEEPLSVDITALTAQQVDTKYPASSQIRITTGDGFNYYFGGALKNLEYAFPLQTVNTAIPRPVINAWHLTKVVSPDGQELNFNYRNFDPSLSGETLNDTCHFIYNRYYEAVYKIYSKDESSIRYDPAVTATKTCYLESITGSNFTLSFNYSQKAKRFYDDNSFIGNYNQRNLQLNSILLTNKAGSVIRKAAFNYEYLGAMEKRFFLTSLVQQDNEVYRFSYYDTPMIPRYDTKGIDHWGFYNGRNNTVMIPQTAQDGLGDETILGAERDPVALYGKIGMLQQITYPTGGFTQFEYEPHDYSKRLERRSSVGFMPTPVSATGTAGGVRIRKITDNDGRDNTNVRTFFYQRDYPGNASSGFLMDYPRYTYRFIFNVPGGPLETIFMKSSSCHSNYNVDENYIHYTEVTEVLANGARTVYNFAGYENTPDAATDNQYRDITIPEANINVPALYRNYVGLKMGDRSFNRGKMIGQNTYNAAGLLVKSKKLTYQSIDQAYNKSVGVQDISGGTTNAYRIYGKISMLSQEMEKSFDPGYQAITVTSDYEYASGDKYSLPVKVTTTNSKGQQIAINYRYPFDITTMPASQVTTQSPVGFMLQRYQIGKPLETTRTLSENGKATLLLDATVNTYQPVPLQNSAGTAIPAVKPKDVYQLEAQQPFPSTGYYPYRVNRYPNGEVGLMDSLNLKKRATYTDYDDAGNITGFIGPDGITQSFIWGYNKTYPVCKAAGAARQDIAYTSFEDGSYGGWNYPIDGSSINATAPTGMKVGWIGGKGSLFYYLTAYGLSPAKRYTVSYWSNGGRYNVDGTTKVVTGPAVKGWVYYEHTVTGVSNVGISPGGAGGNIDEVRLYLEGVQMKTYTYEPLRGITGICDERNRIIHYTYDNAGRLQHIIDQDGNILKKVDYQYQVPVTQ